ncbi:MAG: glycerol-3-phosphate 1-O-acyltransferase PlsY [Puniceicoccales bacterium]|jgi:glycerol-3-phosphate acyltransferase PlsY|nr:glycerol-3-phosphate 1-O-acyltransferase PlsY [Puniceicoccales bacterium]
MSDSRLLLIAAGAAGYLLGSIPFAVIVARRHGVDVMRAGSCNPGATNVKRLCGKFAGNLVFVLDALKGFCAAAWPAWTALVSALGFAHVTDAGVVSAQVAGFTGAVLGHCFSVFLRFKGGKGVAVSAGALLGAMPVCLLVSGGIWLVLFFMKRIVSIASLLAAIAFPVTAYFYYGGAGDPRFWLGVAVALFLVFTHRSNIARLRRGEENRFKKP